MLQKLSSSWATVRLSTRIQLLLVTSLSEVHMPLLECSVQLLKTHASPLHKNATCGCSSSVRLAVRPSVRPITGLCFFCPLRHSVSVASAVLMQCLQEFLISLSPSDVWILVRNSVRFEVFTAENMKNVVFWDIKTQFVPHRRHSYRVQPVNAM
jgi:hypothetical protein